MTSSYRPARGRFLVSEPFMADANFQRTVVLLVEHNDEGSLGFVLNRTMEASLGELVPGLDVPGVPVLLGGPVENTTLHYIHRFSDLDGAREVVPGVYWSGDFEQLKVWSRQGILTPENIIFVVGYSGWGAGQLDAELDRKSWIVAPASETLVFGASQNEQDLWRDVLQTLGERYKIISNYPTDPRLN